MAEKKKEVEVSKEELIEESAEKLKKAKAEDEAREEYTKKLSEERIQLLRSKQGLETDNSLQPKEKEKIQYTTKQKISNFFYHYKLTVIVIAFVVILGGYLVYEAVTTVHPDINVMVILNDEKMEDDTEKIGELMTPYCSDYNNDKKTIVRVDYVPSYTTDDSTTDMYVNQASQARIIAEFQNSNVAMMIIDKESIDYLGITEGIFEDMREYYPDDENATEYGYKITGTTIAKDIGYADMPDDYYISIRVPKSGFGLDYDEFVARNKQAFDILNELIQK